jgi:hypothetical protein
MKTFLLLLVNQSLNIYNSIFNIIEKKKTIHVKSIHHLHGYPF